MDSLPTPTGLSAADEITATQCDAAVSQMTVLPVELAHESLIHTWDKLARWIDESKEELILLAEVIKPLNSGKNEGGGKRTVDK